MTRSNRQVKRALQFACFIYLACTSSSTFCQNSFSKELAFLWKLKLDTMPDEQFTQEYLYRFEKESYRLFKNDEFEMHQAETELVKMVEKLKDHSVFTIDYSAEFNSYNFELEGFECTPLQENTIIKILEHAFGTRLESNSCIELQFLNSSEITLFPIEKEKANMLLKGRKNYKTGKIDRTIRLNISFVLQGIYETVNLISRSRCTLTANILQVDFLDLHEVSDEPLGVVTTAFKEKFDGMILLKDEHADMKSKLKGIEKEISSDEELMREIQNILSNSSLNDKLKAGLIKSTFESYQNKRYNVSSAN